MRKYRKDFEADEVKTLAPYAVLSKDYGERLHPEDKPDDTRSAFGRDIDKLVFCFSLRRLGGKTQVIEVTERNDNDTTRLPHELQVGSIARNIAKGLGLNHELAEAIALGHDLGHTPFGHAGEVALNKKLKEYGYKAGFEHNRHSLHVVDSIEDLNLTNATREGMMKHKSVHDQFDVDFETQPHLEGQVVNRADEIAYTAHDIWDALRKGLITIDDLKKTKIWKIAEKGIDKKHPHYIRSCISQMIGFLINDLQETTDKMLDKNEIQTVDDVRKCKHELVMFTCETDEMLQEIGEILWNKFYKSKVVENANKKGQKIISELFEIYYNDHTQLEEEDQTKIAEGANPLEVIRDYIASFTDEYAIEQWNKHNPDKDEMSKL